MFEGVVSQVLAGYLGRYVKGIQKDQLRIGIWKEEVLLENVELILEAFDYLRLPVALKNDNKTGQSFMSYISAKILDNIQVSVRNVHFVYMDSHNAQEKFVFGLRFASLTVMTDTLKATSTMSSGKSRGGQVNKVVEISTVELYCNLSEETHNLLAVDNSGDLQCCSNTKLEKKIDDFIVHPFDVTLHLLANKSGTLDSAPQYAITAEISSFVLSLNEVQLQQLLIFSDYLSISGLREKYGRYRPSQNYLSMKTVGWQKMWWHYAQKSVLADVRQKLRKTSWSYFGMRISERRKYVNLYRRKLELLQKEQLVSKDILHELEMMDKECDIDDILTYRSTAEQQLQVLYTTT